MHMIDTVPILFVGGAFLFLIGRMVVDYIKPSQLEFGGICPAV